MMLAEDVDDNDDDDDEHRLNKKTRIFEKFNAPTLFFFFFFYTYRRRGRVNVCTYMCIYTLIEYK